MDDNRTSDNSSVKNVLSQNFSSGPHGLGDPDDRSLRKVETEIMIPKIMREKAKTEKCTRQVEAFEKCCKTNGLWMTIRCRAENSDLTSCLTHWYEDTDFKKQCTEKYLEERSNYRRTGIRQKDAQRIATGSF